MALGKAPIPITDLNLQPFTAFNPAGVLLVSGTDTLDANPMTISWGMFGIMWGRPIMMAMVRFSRHTWSYITKAPDFTVNWMPEDWSDALSICGSQSGRDIDKFATTGMTPIASAVVQSPIIAESALALECRTLYHADLDPALFLDQSVLEMYKDGDFHGLFFGEIVAAVGIEQYRRN